MMKTIVVPTDLSREADHAMEVAIILARQMKASIELVHIIQSLYETQYANTANLPLQGKRALEKDIQQAEKELAELVKTYAVADVEIRPWVKVGSIFQDIADNIVTSAGDLMVLGTKGDSGMHEYLIGSNAEKVVRRARCPVITVRRKVKQFQLQQVVFATDFSAKADPLLAILKQWKEVSSFAIHLLYVNTPQHFATTAQINKRMQAFLKKQAATDFTTAIENEYSQQEGIQQYAQEIGADLIAMLTHGREGVGHMLAGSIAEQVVNRANIPVLTYSLHTTETVML